METINFVYNGLEKERLDKFLASSLTEYSRSFIQSLIKEGYVDVNGKLEKANYILKTGDSIEVRVKDVEESDIEPEDIPLDIVYEDSDIIVINKPSGMVVHPGAGNYAHTLVNALLFHCKDLSGINGKIRAGIVHRIDKDTSGLIVACKNDNAHHSLSEQFQNHEVKKVYLALVSGIIPHNLGHIDAPLVRDPKNREQYIVMQGGKNAITNFRVIDRFSDATLIEVEIETGRTHQIRAHMKYIGYPIIGDPIYGLKREIVPTGQFLHAKHLEFKHPESGKLMVFDQDVPEYFNEKIEELRKRM